MSTFLFLFFTDKFKFHVYVRLDKEGRVNNVCSEPTGQQISSFTALFLKFNPRRLLCNYVTNNMAIDSLRILFGRICFVKPTNVRNIIFKTDRRLHVRTPTDKKILIV